MSAPVILTVTPGNGALDVVLGSQIVVTFDQVIDTATVSLATFSLTGPGQTLFIDPDELISQDPEAITGREYIEGTFSFQTVSSKTVATFTPAVPLQVNSAYKVLVIGADGSITSSGVKNLGGESMQVSYQWGFTVGDLPVLPPGFVPSPLPQLHPRIDPNSIKLIPRFPVGNDLAVELDMVFPANIDPLSFDLNDILVSIEPIVGDPNVIIPSGLNASVTTATNKIKLTISNWP